LWNYHAVVLSNAPLLFLAAAATTVAEYVAARAGLIGIWNFSGAWSLEFELSALDSFPDVLS
jgi:hypothetical protein